MNLEDYAYNEGDRWYVDPQVSLDEQNAFINNLRNSQAQANAQVEQQTRILGAQVPSHLGGLIGGGSYFKSRYQTPQTNQTIAQLRAVNQQQALQQALNNDLAKAKKAYRDAQNNTTTKNGLNDIPLEVTDEGGDAEKYNTEYVGNDKGKQDKINELDRHISGYLQTLGRGGLEGNGIMSNFLENMRRNPNIVTAETFSNFLREQGVSSESKEAFIRDLYQKGIVKNGQDLAAVLAILKFRRGE